MSDKAYAFDNAWDLERERLRGLELRLDPATIRHLETIGVGAGWTCLEIGGGGGSIAQWLARRVGPSGRVVATDLDPRFLEALDEPNLEARRHDVAADDLPQNAFDLVHARLVLEHLPAREIVFKRLVSSLRPGGWLLVEDGDHRGIQAEPPFVAIYPAADVRDSVRVWRAVLAVMQKTGWDPGFGARLPELFVEAALEDIGAESTATLWQGGTPASAMPRWTLERLRDHLLATQSVSARELDREIARFGEPNRRGVHAPIVSVWGRRPQSAE